jgi:uncharacterized protein YecE (DUF72 family)
VVYPRGLPERRWLDHYATLFDTVEINTTFYRLPAASAVASWVEHTPSGFVFAAKASRFLTHMKRLTDMERGTRRFYERIEPLVRSPKLGPVLWQLPPNFHRNDERLAQALAELPPGRHAFEFRNEGWFTDDVYALLREHGVATVLAHDARRPLPEPPPTATFAFVRFHRGERGRRGNYSDRELREWAARIRELAAGREVFCYFNNDWEGFAPRNALRLRRLLDG